MSTKSKTGQYLLNRLSNFFRTTPSRRRRTSHQFAGATALVESLEKRQLPTALVGPAPVACSVTATSETALTVGGQHLTVSNVTTSSSNLAASGISSAHVGAVSSFSFTATASSSTVATLSWSPASGASSYIVDVWMNNAWHQLGKVASSVTAVNVTGLTAGTTYYFDVGASNAAGTTWAPYRSVTTPSSSSNGSNNEPTAATGYTAVSGSLFGASGPQYTDVHQGAEGDCWLLASLAAVAARAPSDITSMFTADGTAVVNGTTVNLYKVRFYNSSGVAEYVVVDTELPSGGQYYDHVANGVEWVALAEKAYAEANSLGYVTTQYPGQDSYASLNGGLPSWAIQAITGLTSSGYAINPTNIAAAWNSGEIIVLGSSSNAKDNLIVGDSSGTHAYAVVGYNASSSSPFELFNPWNTTLTVNGMYNYNGKSVYGGTFWASSTLVSSDFADEFFS